MNELETSRWHFDNVEDIKIDTSRISRTGLPEAILARGKSIDQLCRIIQFHMDKQINMLITRCDKSQMLELSALYTNLKMDVNCGCIWLDYQNHEALTGVVKILTGGSSDLSVAREAQITLELSGVKNVEIISDIGVANLNRSLSFLEKYQMTDVLIVCAGMEGALPSVIAGLVSGVIIAVPTRGGTGGELAGIPALLAMLNSCAPGVAVVNIDGGYQAACVAIRVLKLNLHS